MSFIYPKRLRRPENLRPLSEIPDTDARDRFGLRINFTILEETEQMEARFADAERFIKEAAEVAIRQVGRGMARHLFNLALRESPKGKQPNLEKNDLLLDAYDRAIARGVPLKRAALAAALETTPLNDDALSTAKQIRRLVRERAEKEKAEKELQDEVSTTLFWSVKKNADL
jgi:hypothetical protein